MAIDLGCKLTRDITGKHSLYYALTV